MYATWCPLTSCPSSSSRSCSRWSGTASVFMALATTPRCVSSKKIINFCARVVSGRRKFDHISDIVERLGWLNAKSLVQYHTACSLFKTLRTGAPAYVARTIGPPRNAVHSHATRRSAELSLPRILTEAGRRRLCYRGVSLLNELDIREAVPFKSTLRNVLLEKQRKET